MKSKQKTASVRDNTPRKQAEVISELQNEYLASLQEITRELLQLRDVKSLLNTIALRATSLVHASYGFIYLSEGDELVLQAPTYDLATINIGDREPKPGKGMLGKIWQSGQPFMIENYDTWEERDTAYENKGLRAMAGIPITIQDEKIGVLVVARTNINDRIFTSEEFDILSQFASLASLALTNAQLYTDAQNEIAERKQTEGKLREAEKTLKESEERFRLLSDVSLEGIQIHDDGVILDANLALARQLGYPSPDEFIGKQIMHKHLTPESFKKMSEMIASKAKGTYEVEGIRNDGTHFPVEITSYILNLNGKDVRIASTRDVTERKQAEENLRTAEVKYRTLIEKIPPIVYITGLQQHIGVNYISPRISSLGYTQDEWVADPELWFNRIHPEDQDKVREDIQKSIQTNEPFRSEYRILARDGSIRWFLDEAVDIFDEAGMSIFRQGFMLDITTRKQAEEALSSRERYLALLNEMTRAILLSRDFDTTLHTLALNMARLIHADDCYIARWDEEIQKVTPVATTIKIIEGLYPSYRDAPSEDLKLALAVLNERQVIAVDDVYNSPYVKVEFVKRYPIRSALGVPLIAGGDKLGAAIIVFNTLHDFTPAEIEQAEQAGNQVALALWNFQQGIEIQQRLRESNALAKISQALSESEHVGTGKVLQLIVDSACELMPNAEKSIIHLLEADEQRLTARAVSGFDKREKETRQVNMRLGDGIAGRVMRDGITMNIGDVKNNPYFLAVDPSAKFNSLLVVPVQSGGRRIGTISIESDSMNAFTSKDSELLNALALQANVAIENTRLFEKNQQSLKEVNTLYQISRGLAASLDADQLIQEMIGLLQRIFDYYHVQIYLVDPETGDLVVKHGSGYIGDELIQRGHHLPAGAGIVGHVAETGEPFMTNNVEDVSFFKRNPLLAQTQYEMAVPIKIDQRVAGVMDIQQIPPHRLTDGDLQLMSAIADQLAVVLQKADLYSTLQAALQQEQIVRSQLVQSERLALVGQLLASVSHELSNPLQVMQYALSLLKEDESLSPQGKQDLDVVLSEAERMAVLFKRLRSAYRPGRMEDFQSIGLNRLVEDVYALISTHMRHKEIIFEFFPEPDLPNVSGLSDQLRQVLLNLFLNAVEIMGPGGRLTVLTRSLYPQNEITLTVKDNGPGIDPNILPHIFDAFITSKDTGTGLGLTITHDIIQQHRGRIVAENDPQGGAIFHIWLPIHERGEK
jgi:PAS domain S-box-containing protein